LRITGGYGCPGVTSSRFALTLPLSSIKTEGQLCSMVKTRSSISEEQAKRDVEAGMQGKQF
jgi:hypothetical protein